MKHKKTQDRIKKKFFFSLFARSCEVSLADPVKLDMHTVTFQQRRYDTVPTYHTSLQQDSVICCCSTTEKTADSDRPSARVYNGVNGDSAVFTCVGPAVETQFPLVPIKCKSNNLAVNN